MPRKNKTQESRRRKSKKHRSRVLRIDKEREIQPRYRSLDDPYLEEDYSDWEKYVHDGSELPSDS